MSSRKLKEDEVHHIAKLYRLGLSQEDITVLRDQLSDILTHFQVLNNVDTSDVPPTGHSGDLENVMRNDELGQTLTVEETLSNAPIVKDNYFRVKVVLD